MDVGELDKRITLKAKGTTQSSTGAITGASSTIATVWAKIIWLGSRERFISERPIAFKAGKAFIWFRSDVFQKSFFTFESVNYEIIGLKEIGNKEFLELTFEQVQ